MLCSNTSNQKNMNHFRGTTEGVDVPFGPPPEEYTYRCSQCRYEMKVNEAIIDVEIGVAQFENRYSEGYMPILGCPVCNNETMEYDEG